MRWSLILIIKYICKSFHNCKPYLTHVLKLTLIMNGLDGEKMAPYLATWINLVSTISVPDFILFCDVIKMYDRRRLIWNDFHFELKLFQEKLCVIYFTSSYIDLTAVNFICVIYPYLFIRFCSVYLLNLLIYLYENYISTSMGYCKPEIKYFKHCVIASVYR